MSKKIATIVLSITVFIQFFNISVLAEEMENIYVTNTHLSKETETESEVQDERSTNTELYESTENDMEENSENAGFGDIPVESDDALSGIFEDNQKMTSIDYEYIVNDERKAVITKYIGTNENVIIPDSLGGYVVCGIASQAFSGNMIIVELSFDTTEFRMIQAEAFAGCSSLERILLPSTLEYLGDKAFGDCIQLKQVDNVPQSLNNGAYELDEDDPYYNTEGPRPFSGCTGLTEVTFEEGIKRIPNFLFSGVNCGVETNETVLQHIVIPDTVEEIGGYAFENCDSLLSIDLPEGLRTIDEYAFYQCDSLKSVRLPGSLRDLCACSFAECTQLTTVNNIPQALNEGRCGYYDYDDEDYDDIKGPFEGCTRLSEVTFENGITAIPSRLFYSVHSGEEPGETGLECIAIPETVEKIGDCAFYNCDKLSEIALPEGIREIESYAFSQCKSLTSIRLPSTLKYLYRCAFSECTSLQRVENIPEALNSGECGYISYDEGWLDELYGPFEGCTRLIEVTFEEGISRIPETIFYNVSSKPGSEECGLQHVTIPETVKKIGSFAFYYCSDLAEIVFPEGLTSIGSAAFLGCKYLKSITLPPQTEYVGSSAFYDCTSLQELFVLSPNTYLNDTFLSNPRKVKIYGYVNSSAQQYADSVGAQFIALAPELKLTVNGIEDCYVDKPMVISAIAEGGIAPFEYSFSIKQSDGSMILADYSEKNSFVWTPIDVGIGEIKACVKDSKGVITTVDLPILIRENIAVEYKSLVQDDGWQDYVRDGETAGTVGQSKRLEAIKIELNGSKYTGDIEYQTHLQKYGWENEWKKNGEISGSLESLRLESIKIRLTGELADKYDIYYRLHVQVYGWLDWAKNGEKSGTSGFGYRVEGIQIKLALKNEPAPGSTNITSHDAWVEHFTAINYQTQVQKIGWLDTVSNGEMSGTQQLGLRVEGIKMWLSPKGFNGSVEYKSLIQNKGWESTWKKDGELSGTSGKSLRLEAIQIRLTGEIARQYDIYYRVQAQKYGWLGWASNGAKAGSEGHAKRLEAIEIRLVKKGDPAPGSTETPFIQ